MVQRRFVVVPPSGQVRPEVVPVGYRPQLFPFPHRLRLHYCPTRRLRIRVLA